MDGAVEGLQAVGSYACARPAARTVHCWAPHQSKKTRLSIKNVDYYVDCNAGSGSCAGAHHAAGSTSDASQASAQPRHANPCCGAKQPLNSMCRVKCMFGISCRKLFNCFEDGGRSPPKTPGPRKGGLNPHKLEAPVKRQEPPPPQGAIAQKNQRLQFCQGTGFGIGNWGN